MIGLTSWMVYNSSFILGQENNKLELYTDFLEEFSLSNLRDEFAEILDILTITNKDLQGISIIKAYKKPRIKNETD